ncbi:MAG: DUF4270 family protein [Cryomorphaceae bacterium]|nr:DUF4270 domain-containing protein [Flavobacteriales bacterium]
MTNTMKRPYFLAALFFLGALILTTSCERPEEDLGLDLQPGEDILGVNAIDTFTVNAFTLLEDSIRTDKVSPALVGAYIDPVFGFTKCSHVTELRLSSGTPVFIQGGATADDIIVDSLVLKIGFPPSSNFGGDNAVYGSRGAQYFQVFEVLDSLSIDSAYYSNRMASIGNQDLILEGKNRVAPNPIDQVVVGGDTLPAQMRFPLDTELGRRIIEAGGNTGMSNADFVSILRGLMITVDETRSLINSRSSGIVSFDTFFEFSDLTMYYRNTVTEDTLSYVFDIRSNVGKYNIFEHDFTSADISLFDQLNGNPEPGARDLYVQATGGTRVQLEMPYIENLRGDSGSVAINKAELVVPARAGRTGKFPPPQRLYLYGVDDEGALFLIPDEFDELIGGAYDPQINGYRFIITRYIQQILLGNRENQPLQIVAGRSTLFYDNLGAFTANRVVLNGPQYPDAANPSNNLKLAITLTNF